MFRLATVIGDVVVSTVGDYRPKYMHGKRDRIGWNRTYETMVFRFGKRCAEKDCMCGAPEIDPREIDSGAYNDGGAATAGHMALCRKWAELDGKVHDAAD